MARFYSAILKSGLATVAMGLAGSASAAIVYNFAAVPVGNAGAFNSASGVFRLVLPDFLYSSRDFDVQAFRPCIVNFPVPSECGTISFFDNRNGPGPAASVIVFRAYGKPSFDTAYVFDPGIFLAVGTYYATNGAQTGRSASLVVTEENLAPPLPEPGTWAMMIAGFGIAGMALRRRQQVSVSFG
jgi:PEP-CTERM motif